MSSNKILAFSRSYKNGLNERGDLVGSLVVNTEDIVNGNLWRVFPAINCDKYATIPSDYPGPIGVPITIMDKFNPEQFEIVCMLNHGSIGSERSDLYRRIVVRNLRPELPEKIDLAAWLLALGVPVEITRVRTDSIPDHATLACKRCKCVGPPVVDGRTLAKKRKEVENEAL